MSHPDALITLPMPAYPDAASSKRAAEFLLLARRAAEQADENWTRWHARAAQAEHGAAGAGERRT